MHVSLSELENTLVKAVTGLGLPLGTGEEAGRAARQAALDGWNALPAFVSALETLAGGVSGAFDQATAAEGLFRSADSSVALSALLAAPPACDLLLASDAPITLERLDCPGVVLAQVRGRLVTSPLMDHVFFACGDGEGESLSGLCCAAGSRSPGDAPAKLFEAGPQTVTLSTTATPPTTPPRFAPSRALLEGVELEDDLWRRLYRFYARTLVEASETSRLSGAGAGLTDND